MRYLSDACRESITRSSSAVLRPVEAGYERIRRMVFLGSITKTERMVKAMPRESTLVVSWWSSLGNVSLGTHSDTNQVIERVRNG
jgi:hypothetical protein